MSKEGLVTYGRRKRRPPCNLEEQGEEEEQESKSPTPSVISSTTHKYEQYFLDFGQLDFSYSTCKICGILYACGHGDDEKLHAQFHKRYLRGVLFKGWQKERLIVKHDRDDERIILVLQSDPLQHQLKVKELVKIMEKDLGIDPEWLLHDKCKVYLYISTRKVVGCAVTEPVSKAYPVLWEKEPTAATKKPEQCIDLHNNTNEIDLSLLSSDSPRNGMPKLCRSGFPLSDETSRVHHNCEDGLMSTLVFGGFKFQRERVQRCRVQTPAPVKEHPLTICTESSPVAAVCGIRGLWVIKSERRRGIATRLVDAVRTSFVYGLILDASQCAFSQPTAEGKAFAAKYSKTDRYLVYT